MNLINVNALHVSRIDFTQNLWGLAEEEMTAVFDDRDITEEEVNQIIRSGEYTSSSKVAIMPLKTFQIVFRSVRDMVTGAAEE